METTDFSKRQGKVRKESENHGNVLSLPKSSSSHHAIWDSVLQSPAKDPFVYAKDPFVYAQEPFANTEDPFAYAQEPFAYVCYIGCLFFKSCFFMFVFLSFLFA